MEKIPIALNQNTEGLSNGADFNKSPQTYKKDRKTRYKWKITKAQNLNIAFEILLNDDRDIELIPIVVTKAFLEVVKEHLKPLELWVLNELVEKRHDKLNKRIEEIKSGADSDLYLEYHEYDPKDETVSCNHIGEPVYKHGDYVPNADLEEMESERDILFELHSELNDLIYFEPTKKELEFIGQAMA